MKTNKIIVYTVCGVFLLSALFCLVTFAYSSIENISPAEMDRQLAKYKEQEAKGLKLQQTHEKWQQFQQIFGRFTDEYLMKMDDFSKFRDELRVIFRNNRLTNPRGVQHRYKPVLRDFIRVEVSFTLTGDYPNFKRFIHDINSRKKMILFRSIQLNTDKRRGFIVGKFKMEVYLAR